MSVTLADLKRTVWTSLGARCTEFSSTDSVLFYLTHTDYHLRVQLVLNQKYGHRSPVQNLTSIHTLVRKDGSDLDYAERSWSEILAVCHELQRTMGWGTIGPIRHEGGEVCIHTRRRFNTSREDLERASAHDEESEFLTSIRAVAQELNAAAFALTCFAEGTVGAARIHSLLTTPRGSLRM